MNNAKFGDERPGGRGEEYRYGLRFRPAGMGAVPRGYSRTEPHPDFRPFGAIIYDHPLPETERKNYQLARILPAEAFRKRVREYMREYEYADEMLEDMAESGADERFWRNTQLGLTVSQIAREFEEGGIHHGGEHGIKDAVLDWLAESRPTTAESPREGERTLSVASNTLVLRGGRWHRVEAGAARRDWSGNSGTPPRGGRSPR